MYNYKNLYLLGGAEYSRIYFYRCKDDTLEEILSDGYFQDPKDNLYEGNVLYVTGKELDTAVQQIYYNEDEQVCLRKLNEGIIHERND